MDASTASGGNGFDAALRALEDLETSVAQVRDEKPAAVVEPVAAPAAPAEPAAIAAAEPVLPPVSALAFSDGEGSDTPVAIAAVPLTEIEPAVAAIAAAPAASLSETAVADHPPIVVPELAAIAAAVDSAVDGGAAPIDAAPAAIAADAPPAKAGKPAKAARVASGSGIWTKVAVGLGLASSVVSAAGLIIAERTIMSAQLVIATARERQEQLEHATKLIHDLELVRDKQVELLKAQQAQLANAPVSSAELQHRMEVLQQGIQQRDPVNQVVEAIRGGQVDTNARFNEFGLKIERLEASLGRH